MFYATGGAAQFSDPSVLEKPSIIFETQMGLIDRGADVSWLSQFPHEKEILYSPLTGMEVRGSTVEGRVQVYQIVLSVNFTNPTIEEVINKRRKMLFDMQPGLEYELRFAARERKLTGDNDDGIEFLVRQLSQCNHSGPLSRNPEWYNNDSHFSMALAEMLETRSGCTGELPAKHVSLLQRQLKPDQLESLGFNPKAYTQQVCHALQLLDQGDKTNDEEAEGRRVALEMLGDPQCVDQTALVQYAGAVVRRLQDPDWDVCVAAVTTLGKLLAAQVIPRGTPQRIVPVVDRSAAPDWKITEVESASENESEGTGHAEGVHVGKDNTCVREGGSYLVDNIGQPVNTVAADVIARLVRDIKRLLHHPEDHVREAAVMALAQLPPHQLVAHAQAYSHKLADPNERVRCAAVAALGQLEPTKLAMHAPALLEMLTDPDADVRFAVLEALCRLDREALAPLAEAFNLLADHDSDSGIQHRAKIALAQLNGEAPASKSDDEFRMKHLPPRRRRKNLVMPADQL